MYKNIKYQPLQSIDVEEDNVIIVGEEKQLEEEKREKQEEKLPNVWLLERNSLRHCFSIHSSIHIQDDTASLRATMRCYTGLMMVLMVCLLSLSLFGIIYLTDIFPISAWIVLVVCILDSVLWFFIGYRAFYAIWG